MELFIAICEDRHIDTHVRVFDTPERAIDYAIAFMDANARFPEEIEESETQGQLYHAEYSNEGDHVRVEKSHLNDIDI